MNWRGDRRSLGFALLSLVAVANVVVAEEDARNRVPMGAARDVTGQLHILEFGGRLRQLGGTDDGRRLQSLRRGTQIFDVAVDRRGNLVVPMSIVSKKGISAKVGVYDWNGKRLHDVQLPERCWNPKRAAEFNGRIVILATGTNGPALCPLGEDYKSLPEAEMLLEMECEEDSTLLTMAVDEIGMWIAAGEPCEDRYLVHKFDGQGRKVKEIARSVGDFLSEDDEDPLEGDFAWAVLDIFAAGGYVGVVLNGAIRDGKPVDVWTTSGEFVARVKAPAPAVWRAVGMADGTVYFVERDGGVVATNIQALLKDRL